VPFAVRPIGAQLSTRVVVFLGDNFVCAQAGEAIKRIANISFFIGLSPIRRERSFPRRRWITARTLETTDCLFRDISKVRRSGIRQVDIIAVPALSLKSSKGPIIGRSETTSRWSANLYNLTAWSFAGRVYCRCPDHFRARFKLWVR
jgi:hypothetical protein